MPVIESGYSNEIIAAHAVKQGIVITILTLLYVGCGTLSYSQSEQKKHTKSKNMIQASIKSDESLLSELNARFIKNFLTQDTASHNKIIHKDFICIEGSGAIVSREEYIKNWATDFDNSGYITFTYTDEAIRIFGNMALVRSKTVYTKSVEGKTIEGNTIYTDTYVKENGKWICVQAHITPVEKK